VPDAIYSHTYDNGLVLVGEPNPSLESVAFTFRVPAGCRYDPPGKQGLAGFACDMALRGAGERDNRRFTFDLEMLGVQRSESVTNAHMVFSGATLAENLLPALELYADLLRRPQMPSDSLEESRMYVLQELQGIEDEPSHKTMIELQRQHWADPLGRSSQGVWEDIESITLDDVVSYYRRHSQPHDAILGVAGKFDWEQLKLQVGRLLDDWEPRPAAKIALGERGQPMRHLAYDSQQTQIGIAYESVPYRHPDYYQASGAIGVLSGGMSSRLFTEVREKRGLCYTVYASMHSLKETGAVFCYAGTSAERAQETLDVTLGELARLAQGIEQSELTRLKARVKSGLILQGESSISRSSSLARDWYHLGRARSLDEVGQLIDALTCESINAFLSEHPAEDFTVITLGPSPLEVNLGIS